MVEAKHQESRGSRRKKNEKIFEEKSKNKFPIMKENEQVRKGSRSSKHDSDT